MVKKKRLNDDLLPKIIRAAFYAVVAMRQELIIFLQMSTVIEGPDVSYHFS